MFGGGSFIADAELLSLQMRYACTAVLRRERASERAKVGLAACMGYFGMDTDTDSATCTNVPSPFRETHGPSQPQVTHATETETETETDVAS